MSLVADTAQWLLDGSHWSGPEGVPHRLLVHLGISAAAVGLAALIALPPAVLLGHARSRWGNVLVAVSNVTRALPVFGVLIILASTSLGLSTRSTVLALTLFAIPPLLTNAFLGVRDVDTDVVEAARGNGMSGLQVLRSVELPLALPLIAAGFRTSAVQVVATATLAAYVGGGGLGQFINEGFARGDQPETAAGGVLVALLALLVEVVLALVQRRVQPPAETRL
ncbi:MAG: transporter permease [Frankiales bacterium]|nr:transporter permease [Frankiales bacterium]